MEKRNNTQQYELYKNKSGRPPATYDERSQAGHGTRIFCPILFLGGIPALEIHNKHILRTIWISCSRDKSRPTHQGVGKDVYIPTGITGA